MEQSKTIVTTQYVNDQYTVQYIDHQESGDVEEYYFDDIDELKRIFEKCNNQNQDITVSFPVEYGKQKDKFSPFTCLTPEDYYPYEKELSFEKEKIIEYKYDLKELAYDTLVMPAPYHENCICRRGRSSRSNGKYKCKKTRLEKVLRTHGSVVVRTTK